MEDVLNYLPILFAIIYLIVSLVGKVGKKESKPSSKPSAGNQMTWEDMEREYGIKIERKPSQEPQNPSGVSYQADEMEGSYDGGLQTQTEAQSEDQYLSREDLRRHREAQAAERAAQASADRDELARQQALRAKMAKIKKASSQEDTSGDDFIKRGQIGGVRDLSKDSFRQGILWSMVLDRPKAMRRR